MPRTGGFEFTVPQVDDLDDIHGDITDPKLVLYVGGNYFFAMATWLRSSRRHIPTTRDGLLGDNPPGADSSESGGRWHE